MAKSTLKCSSVVVPLQDKAPVRFIVMNFKIGHRPYEMEAVFCNEKMLMVGENSGVWTRLEWINEFNIPKFNMKRHYIHIGDLNNMRITSTCSAYGGKLHPITNNSAIR